MLNINLSTVNLNGIVMKEEWGAGIFLKAFSGSKQGSQSNCVFNVSRCLLNVQRHVLDGII
jgi:hypothetical protein